MSENKITTLYNHFKNTPKKLKIVCDWDEVIQACKPYALWKALRGEEREGEPSGFFRGFWWKNIVEYFPYGSKLKEGIFEKDDFDRQKEIKNSPDFYQQAPFLTIAEDLLKLIKEDKVEQLIFLSAYDRRKFPEGDERKSEMFKNSFGKIPLDKYLRQPFKERIDIELQLIPFDNEEKGQTKADWIKQNASDFDIFIDDNPNICREIENYRIIKPCSDCMDKYMNNDCVKRGETHYSCGNCPRRKMTLFAPYYPATANQHHKEVLLVKNEVSELKKEEFK
ncbi:protein of unknown function [endosymbiont DhMRE of Dentiscutata heterogama]|uniref:hypothetical protein n=1 Tax=endosymbiont DhMRE of Dentiscutata heterogama TaxID=1609546 RepID=UPI000629D2B9|nr:hypothetical protein [endosymbiont DhMRE of Dentiscutata heterogama]CFW92951.1 protein of unknown function [endosymbiont DhMRE of Dentiscutata heterogama]